MPSENMLFIKYFTTSRCYTLLKVLKYNFSKVWIMLFHVSFTNMMTVSLMFV
jgi:hypothetical protein